MAYDEAFADRVRGLLQDAEGVTERKMFGGLGFMVHGHMAVAVSGRDVMMLRADPQTEDRLLDREGVEQTVMRGRPMSGWLDVGPELTGDDAALRELVEGAVAHVRTLPPKG